VQEIFGYENTKKILNEIKLDLPYTPDITDIKINRLSKKRYKKILEEIIKSKDNLIKKLYKDNLSLHKELSKQSKIVDEAEKYQKERDKIIADNEELHNTVNNFGHEYKLFPIDKFIELVCQKFSLGNSKELIRNFEENTNISLDPEQQIKKEEIEKEWDLEL